MCRAAAWERKNSDFRLVSITASQSSSLKSSASARRMIPALLTRMSSRPSSANGPVDDLLDRARWSTGRPRSSPRGGRSLRDLLAVSSAGVRPTSATSAPASASATAIALADAGVGAGDDRDFAADRSNGLTHCSWQMSRTFMSV